MTKADLIDMIAEKKGITCVKAETVVNTIFDTMVEALLRDDRIEIGFGSLPTKPTIRIKGAIPAPAK